MCMQKTLYDVDGLEVIIKGYHRISCHKYIFRKILKKYKNNKFLLYPFSYLLAFEGH